MENVVFMSLLDSRSVEMMYYDGTSCSYFIAAPNLLRVGVEETVSITVDNADQNVKLYLQDFPHRRKTFSQVEKRFLRGIPDSLKVKLEAKDLPNQKSLDKQYVYLVADGGSFHDKIPVLVSYRNAMVFVQTDKPIYTPGQLVHIRVISLDINLRPSIKNITIDLMNPQGIRVQRWHQVIAYKGFFLEKKKLEENILLGNWTVCALYGHGGVQNASVRFEVRKYVLPKFSVKIEAPDYVLEKDKEIRIKVVSKYTYGKPVQGNLQLSVAVLDVGGKTTRFSTTFNELTDGKYEEVVDVDLMKKHPDIQWFPDGKRLFIEAKVREKATGIQETALKNNVYFTKSPYKISFKRTPNFFKPAVPFEVKVDLSYINGEAASGVACVIDTKTDSGRVLQRRHGGARGVQKEITTDKYGQISFEFDIPRDFNIKHLDIKVMTRSRPSSSALFQPSIYASPGNNYLFVRCPKAQVGQTVYAEAFAVTNSNPSRLTYMVTARGQIVKQGVISRNIGVLTTIPIDVTYLMSPRARLVVYYIVGNEIVVDSTVIEVEETFENNVHFTQHQGQLGVNNGVTKEPKDVYDIKIRATPYSRIGLLAVDQSVYLLRKNKQLTSKTVFSRINTHDLGCGWGGGQNNKDVFTKSGLSIMSGHLKTSQRNDYDCNHGNRQRRSLSKNAGSRSRSADSNVPPNRFQDDFDLAAEELEELLSDVQARTKFPETGIYEEQYADKNGEAVFQATVPGTITTWVMQAVAVSDTTGFGLTPPFYLKSFKKFFVSLSLPHSAQLGEQVSVIATIFNYHDKKDKIYVRVFPNDEMCSISGPGRPYFQKYDINANDVLSISFPIVPLTIGEVPIKVSAQSLSIGSDMVEKTIKVVPQGKHQRKTYSLVLDPEETLSDPKAPKPVNPTTSSSVIKTGRKGNGIQLNGIKLHIPASTVQESESSKLKLLGDIIGLVSNMIQRQGLEKFVRYPHSRGERTMLKLGPLVYVIKYLRETKQVTPEIERRAFTFIKHGYQHELRSRQSDGSFSLFTTRPSVHPWFLSVRRRVRRSSTWLTAFVMKTFCAVQKLGGIDIDNNVICNAMTYISGLQRNNGVIPELHPVFYQEINGDIKGDIAMTAYAVTAFLECSCNTVQSANTITKAVSYLESIRPTIKRPYVKAVVAYALALANSPERFAANTQLMLDASYNADRKTRHWPERNNAVTVETTSYALLTQILLKRFDYSGPIIVWLTGQSKGGVGFVSTQDICVALQALSAYSEATSGNHLDLLVEVTSSRDSQYKETLRVDKTNALIQQQLDVSDHIGHEIFIKTTGYGVTLLQVETIYNIPFNEKEACHFDITITTSEKDKCASSKPIIKERPKQKGTKKRANSRRGKGRKRNSRSRKQRKNKKNKPQNMKPVLRGGNRGVNAIQFKICVKFKERRGTGMAIIDIGLLTGFSAVKQSIEDLKSDVKPGVIHYEILDRNIILHLDKIPGTHSLCFRLEMKQDFEVGLLQPVPVVVYDYYERDKRCTTYYGADDDSQLQLALCDKQNCQCIQDKCPKCNNPVTKKEICDKYDYAFKGKIRVLGEYGKSLEIKLDVEQVYKNTADKKIKKGARFIFRTQLSCECPHLNADTVGKKYLFMGSARNLRHRNNGVYTGAIDNRMLVEKWSPKFTNMLSDPNLCGS